MARKDVHYEVFLKKHKKASWALVEAIGDRQEALDLAQGFGAGQARVMDPGGERVSRRHDLRGRRGAFQRARRKDRRGQPAVSDPG